MGVQATAASVRVVTHGNMTLRMQRSVGERSEGMNGKNRQDITPGLRVNITQKPDQRSGKLTGGIVKDILTTSAYHPHGIKVRLDTGDVGRVQEMVETGHEATEQDRPDSRR
jgi:uncharacterized repeat protein (TIGR03833 family)